MPSPTSLPFRLDGPRRTPRLVLRPFADDDLAAVAGMWCDPDAARWLYRDARSPEEVPGLLAAKRGQLELAADGDAISLAAVLADTGELVADVILILRSAVHAQGEIGYHVDRAHQGRGYATEAALGLLAIGFDEVGLHRIVGRLEPRNVASARVLERAGMRREALLVENEHVKGEWQSEAIHALLRREWDARKARAASPSGGIRTGAAPIRIPPDGEAAQRSG